MMRNRRYSLIFPHGTGRAPRTSLIAACVLILLLPACVTQQMAVPPSPDALEEIPPGTRVTVETRSGETLKLKVTESTSTALHGRDRHFRAHEVPQKEILHIEAPPQHDWWVALSWVGVVFVAAH